MPAHPPLASPPSGSWDAGYERSLQLMGFIPCDRIPGGWRLNMFGIDVSACEVFDKLCFVATRATRREFARAEVSVSVSAGVGGVAAALAQILDQLHLAAVPKDARDARRFVSSVATYRPWLRVSRAGLRRLL